LAVYFLILLSAVFADTDMMEFGTGYGMIRGTFIVKDNINVKNTEDITNELKSIAAPSGGSCSMGGGGCGCGG